jgi:ankyrin repeat protein
MKSKSRSRLNSRLLVGAAALLLLCALDLVSLFTTGIGILPVAVAKPLTPLMRAAKADDVTTAENLLKEGADPNERRGSSMELGFCFVVACSKESIYGETALTVAIDSESIAMVNWLLDHGAKIDVPDSRGEDSFAHATERIGSPISGQPQAGDAVFNNIVDHQRGSLSAANVAKALDAAVRLERLDLVERLLPFRPNDAALTGPVCRVSSLSTSGSREAFDLMLSSVKEIPPDFSICPLSLYAAKMFLDRGLDPNMRVDDGSTMLTQQIQNVDPVLETACDCSKLESVYTIQLLLKHGADPKLGSVKAPSAVDVSQRNGRPQLVKLLTTGRMMQPNASGVPEACPPVVTCPRTLLPPELMTTTDLKH